MAKSARASRTKTNNARLRSTVFAPADAARALRLSARLLAAAKAQEEAKMRVEVEADGNVEGADAERMEMGEGGEEGKKASGSLEKKKVSAARIKRRQASKHAVVFPSLRKTGGRGKKGGRISKK
ncbi:hypothetical protein L873DRAFT_1809425 [Choiromyces venosus 120613-1]|uniref:DUF2423 domain-containing protein n=1 Tax=Choiromyces venosus 120613-1 TaxID=1336337 RepID=A0A3N4JHB1_9PEZI|nr:hypothetical protein L873DRAFT_1809425 [Choiromyces venosus 120613-1]